MKHTILRLLTPALVAGAFSASPLLGADEAAWPTGSSPQEIGLRVAQHFVTTPHGDGVRPRPATAIIYPEVCTWYGALTFAQLTGNKDLTAQARQALRADVRRGSQDDSARGQRGQHHFRRHSPGALY